LTFHFVVLARILFRAPSVAAAGDVGRALMTADWGLSRVDKGTWAILVLGYALHWSPPDLIDRVRRQFVGMPAYAQGLALATLAVGMAAVAETDVVPFIYFQF
jgi:alginate O-acetyltransferase complex protein AlgI